MKAASAHCSALLACCHSPSHHLLLSLQGIISGLGRELNEHLGTVLCPPTCAPLQGIISGLGRELNTGWLTVKNVIQVGGAGLGGLQCITQGRELNTGWLTVKNVIQVGGAGLGGLQCITQGQELNPSWLTVKNVIQVGGGGLGGLECITQGRERISGLPAPLPPTPPGGCCHQPGQQRRCAAGQQGEGHRHQLGYCGSYREGSQLGGGLCNSDINGQGEK